MGSLDMVSSRKWDHPHQEGLPVPEANTSGIQAKAGHGLIYYLGDGLASAGDDLRRVNAVGPNFKRPENRGPMGV